MELNTGQEKELRCVNSLYVVNSKWLGCGTGQYDRLWVVSCVESAIKENSCNIGCLYHIKE
jgi:hypothetical protein